MDSSDITKAVIIIVIFIVINIMIILSMGIKNIQKEWPKYRCNPLVMPFATLFNKDPVTNFESCIKNIQTINMGEILDPVYNIFSSISDIGDDIVNNIVNFSGVLNIFKLNLGGIINYMLELIINILIEIQVLIMKFKDIIDKLIGIFITLIYVIAGTQTTTLTIWNGLPGWLIKAVTGFVDETAESISKNDDKDKNTDNDNDTKSN